jgi:hypothetical protein
MCEFVLSLYRVGWHFLVQTSYSLRRARESEQML